MDKENNEDEPNDGQSQSETGRETRIQTCFLINSASSPLFYTVSGNQSQEKVVGGKRYYLEQLGCPSIIKPSFRDLPGCTRLSSVGVPSPSYRQFPLDKLNKTIMGKSPPTTTTATGKRFSVNRGERFMSPIKVNTKIRHIYSHITSTTTSDEPSGTTSNRSRTTSHQSSILSASTHTQTEEDELQYQGDGDGQPPPIQSIDEETTMDHEDLRRDVSTCMTPPLQMISPDTSLAYSIPPAYAGKLEDLEKITGHIVIQRFFTRADEAFGIWLEKQLGMNVKSVGVGREDDIIDAASATTPPSPPPLHPNLESFTGSGTETASAKKMRESRILEKIIEVDDILAGEEIIPVPVEISKQTTPTLGVQDKHCSMDDNVKCECFWKQFNQVGERCEATIANTITADEITNLTKLEQDIIDQCIAVEIIRGKQNIEELQLMTDSRFEKQMPEMPIILSLDDSMESTSSTVDQPCIPDVIDVSQFYTKTPQPTLPQPQSQSEETTTETTNEDSEDLKTVISNQSSMTDSQLESQYKVVEYLGKLEISSPANDASTSANSINSELDWGGGGPESSKYLEEEVGNGVPDDDVIKRSISVDSCIGTESSGERNIFNDSGILLDSSRMDTDIPEEDGEISSFTNLEKADGNEDKLLMKNVDDVQSQLQTAVESSVDDQAVQIIHRPLLSNNQSIDDSTNYSRSDVSSVALKHITDEGGDADQSESDSELSSLQQKTLEEEDPARQGEEVFQRLDDTEQEDPSALLLDEDDDENDHGSEPDELDQFDTIIENHEKEKRLRPIYRKRNVSTQTSKTVESSTVSCTTGSRSTTATSDSSSFDLEFVSKSKKYFSHHHVPSASKQHQHRQEAAGDEAGLGRKRSYLPTGSSGLNVLNMKFSMGNEFESEVSIRIPAKSPTASIISSSSSFNYQTLPNAIIPSNTQSKGNKKSQTQSQFPAIGGTFIKGHNNRRQDGIASHPGQGPSSSSRTTGKLFPLQPEQDPELKTLWKDVKSKMESRVETDLQVTGSKINLVTSSGEEPYFSAMGTSTSTNRILSRTAGGGGDEQGSESRTTKLPILISTNEQEKLKRSLKRLKRILDD